MDHPTGAIELRIRWASGAIAERNEEINRHRLAGGGGGGGDPLRVTDPAALARLMAEMKAKAEQQRAAEDAREAERRQREGAAYQPPEQRAEAARAARAAATEERAGGQEAQVLEKRFDPSRDYYQLLGIPRGASTADIRKAYKKLALLYHPDKHKAAGAEQQAAIQDKFKQVVEAFDVLSDEEQRRVYDKIRDYQEANPGRGLPLLSPEEAALMRSGIAELVRLRRMGAKATKHPPLEKEVFVSLAKLNAGCAKMVAVERRRVRPDGIAFLSSKNIHLIIRRGSPEGDRLVFEGDGEESVDTLPGDLVLVLRAKPHPLFRRSGAKDLELFCGSLARGDVLFAVEVTTLQGKRRLLTGSAFRVAAANAGMGGVWQAELPGQGLYDTADPWEKPPGSLRVQMRYPSCLLEEASVACCLAPQPVQLLGSGRDVVAAALAAGCMAGLLCHRLEAAEMAAHEAGGTGSDTASSTSRGSWQDVCSSVASCSSDSSSRRSSAGGHSSSSTSMLDRNGRCPRAVCLVAALGCDSYDASSSPAATAMLWVLLQRVPGLQASTVVSSCLLDEEWLELSQADIIILDWCPTSAGAGADAAGGAMEEEQRVAAVAWQMREEGLLELLWQRFWTGCQLAGVGQGCALLGLQPDEMKAASGGSSNSSSSSSSGPPVLPWYLVRAGGGTEGWATLHLALSTAAAAASALQLCSGSLTGVGVMAGGCWLADPASGRAEMLVAPSRELLVATAAWTSSDPAHDPAAAGLQEAEDADWGYFCELTPQLQ